VLRNFFTADIYLNYFSDTDMEVGKKKRNITVDVDANVEF